MPRKSFTLNARTSRVDAKYKSAVMRLFINQMIKNGKARTAHRIFYGALDALGEKTTDPVETFRTAIRNVTPEVEVKPRRRGGSVYQVPQDVSSERGTTLAIRWIVQAANNRSGRGMIAKLTAELGDAARLTGGAMRKRDDVHRTAQANKAFAHMK